MLGNTLQIRNEINEIIFGGRSWLVLSLHKYDKRFPTAKGFDLDSRPRYCEDLSTTSGGSDLETLLLLKTPKGEKPDKLYITVWCLPS